MFTFSNRIWALYFPLFKYNKTIFKFTFSNTVWDYPFVFCFKNLFLLFFLGIYYFIFNLVILYLHTYIIYFFVREESSEILLQFGRILDIAMQELIDYYYLLASKNIIIILLLLPFII